MNICFTHLIYPSWRQNVLRMGILFLLLLFSVYVSQVNAAQIRIGGTGSSLATIKLVADAFSGEQQTDKITVLPSLGSGGGIKAVLAGKIAFSMSSRPLKEREIKAGAQAVEYARSPFVFAIKSSNSANSITEEQLLNIMTGQEKTWPDGSTIRMVLRPKGDSDTKMVTSISPEISQARQLLGERKGMPFAITDQDSADSIEKIPGALGTSTLGLIKSENRNIKALSWNGVEPSAASLSDGSYPFYKTYYLVTGPKPSPVATKFIQFLQSNTGKEILKNTGHSVK